MSKLWGAGCTKKGCLMVIGDVLTLFEQKTDTLFNSESGKWTLRKLNDIGVNLDEVYFTKAIKSPVGSKKLKREDKNKAYQELILEINALEPRAILILGSVTLDVLFKTSAITKHRGKLRRIGDIPVIPTYNAKAVIRDLSKLEQFNTDLDFFKKLSYDEFKEIDVDIEFITSLERLKSVIESLKNKEWSYDIETPPGGGRPIMFGFCDGQKSYIVPYDDYHCNVMGANFKSVNVCNLLWAAFYENKDTVAHYSKFDNQYLKDNGVVNAFCGFDTFLAAYLLNEPDKSLKALAKKYCNAPEYSEDIEFKKHLTKDEFITMGKYCGRDVYYPLILKPILEENMKSYGVYNVFKYILMPTDRVFQKIERRGAYIDKHKLVKIYKEYSRKRRKYHKELISKLPNKFKDINLNSPKQLQELLFEYLKLPVIEKTDTGEPSTGKKTLMYLAEVHEIPKLILEYRLYEKAINSFLKPWFKHIKKDGRLHTQYNVARTATGRPSAENPNLQQVPRDKNIRSIISAPEGKKIIEADYSQIELRTAAFIFNERNMKKIYANGGDIHTITASQIARCKLEEVTKTLRTSAKAVNFGFLYGMWWESFKEYAYMSYGVKFNDDEAKHARDVYFKTYQDLIKAHERQKREARNTKMVKTPTGRIRLLPNINSPDKDLRGKAERQALNTPVQSFASDMMFIAMTLVDLNLEKYYKNKAFLVGQIHDAILIECDDNIAYQVGQMVKKIMESVPHVLKKYFNIHVDVPIVADVEIGDGWGIGEDLEKFKKVLDKVVV